MRAPATALALLLLPALLATSAAGAPALGGHGARPPTRPLHVRLAEAELVAVGVVDAVELGRIHVRDAVALVGQLPERFEVKRAPSRAPELTPGDAALLVLRGARSPYVLDGEKREMVRFDPERRGAWERAVRAIAEAGGSEELLAVYLRWLEDPADGLRAQALDALADPAAPFHPLPPEVARARAKAAFDAASDPASRRSSAWIAAMTADGAAALLDAVGAHPHPDPGVVSIALQAGLRYGLQGAPSAFAGALLSPDAAVRRAAVRLAPVYADAPEARRALEQLAEREEDPRVREAAARALGQGS